MDWDLSMDRNIQIDYVAILNVMSCNSKSMTLGKLTSMSSMPGWPWEVYTSASCKGVQCPFTCQGGHGASNWTKCSHFLEPPTTNPSQPTQPKDPKLQVPGGLVLSQACQAKILFPLPLVISNLITMCLDIVLFDLYPIWVYWVSWICIFMSPNLRIFSHYLFKYFSPQFFSPSLRHFDTVPLVPAWISSFLLNLFSLYASD
jgi:hypothetical protein